MIGKCHSLASLIVIAASISANAADADWHWIAAGPDGNRGALPWYATQGTAKATFDGKRLMIHLGDEKGLPDFDLTGSVHGNKISATVLNRGTDDDARHFSGIIVLNSDTYRITLTSLDGEFIGLEGPRPSN